MADSSNQGADSSNQDSSADFHIQISTPLGNFHDPVHEDLTIAAAAHSASFNSDSPDGESWIGKYLPHLSSAQYELIRGVFWNDDPLCLLFENYTYDNAQTGAVRGALFAAQFALAENRKLDANNLVFRTHFGNLQFLHAMGENVGEKPFETLRKIKLYLQTMYDVYSGQNGLTPDTAVKSTNIKEFFNDSNGHASTTFKSLFMGTTPKYETPNIRWRTLGSCMHLIQDSFSKGHCRRDNEGTGSILNFHNYNEQDHKKHSHYDGGSRDVELDPTNLESFKSIYGASAALTACVQFLDAAAAKQAWASKLEDWFEKTFAIHPDATKSDSSI